MNNEAAYIALTTEARRIGWPTRYQEDLTKVDRDILTGQPEGFVFGWVLREHGTHLLLKFIDVHTLASPQAFGHKTLLYYFWNGEFLQTLPSAGALANRLDQHNKQQSADANVRYSPQGRINIV